MSTAKDIARSVAYGAARLVPGPLGRAALRGLTPHLQRIEENLLALGRLYDDGSPRLTRVTVDRLTLELHLSDHIERRIYYTGRYERGVEAILRAALGPEARCFADVGANCGYFTLIGARCLLGRGRVHAIEPFPETARRLRRNLELNATLANVTVHELAASDREGTVRLFAQPGSLGETSFLAIAGAEGAEARTVPLDALLAGEPFIDLAKIDVEGADHLVLAGMDGLLAARRVGAVLLEVHPELMRELGGRFEDVPETFLRHGYRLLAEQGSVLAPMDRAAFFATDTGHRFLVATVDDRLAGLRLPKGF